MTLSDVNTKITNLTGVDTNQYASTDRVIDINVWYQKVVSIILDSQDESDYDDPNQTQYPIVTFPLSLNRDYLFEPGISMLKIKDVSITYDGVNYYKAKPTDTGSSYYATAPASATAQNAKIDNQFSKVCPGYDMKYNAFWIYPLANSTDITNGAQAIVEFFRQPVEFTLSDLTAGTKSPGFDASFHAFLAYGPAYEYCRSKGLPQTEAIYRDLLDLEGRIRRQYSSKQLDRRYQLVTDYQNYK